MEIIRTAAECSRFRACCFSSAALRIIRYSFENSEEFNKKLEVRHRVEEKNGEMKTAHGFQRADSVGMVAMRLQAYLTAVVVNMKRIVASIPV